MTDTTDTSVEAGDTRNHGSAEAPAASRMAISEYAEYGQVPFVAEDNDGLFLYIPSVIPAEESTDEQITAYLKTLAPISISTYRYNSDPIDTTQIIRGEKWVDSKVYDPGVLYNLEAKKIDIKEETIVLSDKIPRGLESDTFEIKFQEPNNCCLNKAVLSKDISNSCTILPIEVDYKVTGGSFDPSIICSRIEAKGLIDGVNSIGAIIGVQDGFNVGGIEWWLIDAGKVKTSDGEVVRYPDQFAGHNGPPKPGTPDKTVSYTFDPGNAFAPDDRKTDIKVEAPPPTISEEFNPTVPSKPKPVKPTPLVTDSDDNRRFTNLDFVRDPYLPGFRQ